MKWKTSLYISLSCSIPLLIVWILNILYGNLHATLLLIISSLSLLCAISIAYKEYIKAVENGKEI